jgi:hypothetical protein
MPDDRYQFCKLIITIHDRLWAEQMKPVTPLVNPESLDCARPF